MSVIATDAEAQPRAGAIGVSLTIVQPVATQAVRVTGFSIDADGTVRLETTVPTTAQAAQLVMTRVSTADTRDASMPQSPTIVPSSAAARLHFRLNVGRTPAASRPRLLELRVEYLTIAGT